MVYQHVQASLTDNEYLSRLSSVVNEREEFLAAVNRVRWNNYNEREKIFGMKKGDVFPDDEWQVPEGDQFNLVRENANYAWADALWDAIRTGTVAKVEADERLSSWNPSTSSLPAFEYEFLHLEPSDYSLKGEILTVTSPNDSVILKLELEEKIERIDTDSDWVRVEFGNAPEFTVYYDYEGDSDTDISGSMNRLHTEFNREQQISLSVATASGAFQVAQIECPKENDEFEKMFEELDLAYVELDWYDQMSLYFVTHSERGEDLIQSYLSQESVGIKEYLILMGYPKEVGAFFDQNGNLRYDDEYDRYPSEEFAVYLLEDGRIGSDDIPAFALCPYRPPPSMKQARLAIQLGNQVRRSVEEFCRLHDELEATEVLQRLTYKQKASDSPTKPIFPNSKVPTRELSEPESEVED